jgi:peroxiredoxin
VSLLKRWETETVNKDCNMDAKGEWLRTLIQNSDILGQGSIAPDFTLPDVFGANVSLYDRLKGGAVVLMFHRGTFSSPYSHLQLAAYQEALPEITLAGGQIVAVSQQLPDRNIKVMEHHGLTFDLLSDAGNEVARNFGLLYSAQDDFRRRVGTPAADLMSSDRNNAGEFPIAATFVISPTKTITASFIEADIRKCPSPKQIVSALEAASELMP